MHFIFQGSPSRFAVDDYLTRYEDIYWGAPKLASQMSVGDTAIIWRSGKGGGAVAVGLINESPTRFDSVSRPEALGTDLWREKEDEVSDIKVGISLFDVRLTPEAGMLLREALVDDKVFSTSQIIKAKAGSVFKLSEEQAQAFDLYWSGVATPTSISGAAAGPNEAHEGARRLRRHYARERSPALARSKKEQHRKDHGCLSCEVCGLSGDSNYPNDLYESVMEVHHRTPLSETKGLVKTSLEDLMVVCANCHRVVHRDNDVGKNLKILASHFSK